MISLMGPAPASAANNLEVQRNFAQTICAGLCVDTAITVSEDGIVTWRISDPLKESDLGKTYRFQVSPAAAHDFMARFQATQPEQDRDDPKGCDNAHHQTNKWDWVIHWQATGRQLRACRSDELQAAWVQGLKQLGMPFGLSGPFGSGVKIIE